MGEPERWKCKSYLRVYLVSPMSESKLTQTIAVTNRAGIHARAATLIAELIRGYDAQVLLRKDRESVDSTDVLQVLSLGAGHGEELFLEASGNDAEAALQALVQLFTENFGESQAETEHE